MSGCERIIKWSLLASLALVQPFSCAEDWCRNLPDIDGTWRVSHGDTSEYNGSIVEIVDGTMYIHYYRDERLYVARFEVGEPQ